MAKLKLGAIADDKPVKLDRRTARKRASRSDRLRRGACARNRAANRRSLKLVAPMLARFMATDRAFGKARRLNQTAGEG